MVVANLHAFTFNCTMHMLETESADASRGGPTKPMHHVTTSHHTGAQLKRFGDSLMGKQFMCMHYAPAKIKNEKKCSHNFTITASAN